VVVQCPTCQSRFRIADEKVTDRGVRVRCTSCKNVFQVRKPGAATDAPAPGPGSTMDLPALGATAVARGGAKGRSGAGRAAAARPAASKPAGSRPPPAASARSPNGTARRLDADDLFGMAELTGDAPLPDLEPPSPKPSAPPPRPKSPAAAKPMPNFDDIDLEVDDEPSGPPPSKPPTGPVKGSRPPPPKTSAEPPPAPPEDSPLAPPEAFAVKNGGALKDPFEGMNLGEPGPGAIEMAAAKKEKPAEAAEAPARRAQPAAAPPPVPEIPQGKALVSSALTGLVGAALAIAVVIVAALSDESSAGWLGFARGSDIVATRVVSGLYDTASGKPVFYIRGRVENRSQNTRGPIRVTAELISDGTAEARAEAVAGAEPTAEEVWSLRSAADVERLNRSLEIARTERRIEPGKSLPFFAVIADPPADLQRHRLHVRVESVDAWVPAQPKKGK
jgi:predicted Zn finger-like uncharacterized protein